MYLCISAPLKEALLREAKLRGLPDFHTQQPNSLVGRGLVGSQAATLNL